MDGLGRYHSLDFAFITATGNYDLLGQLTIHAAMIAVRKINEPNRISVTSLFNYRSPFVEINRCNFSLIRPLRVFVSTSSAYVTAIFAGSAEILKS